MRSDAEKARQAAGAFPAGKAAAGVDGSLGPPTASAASRSDVSSRRRSVRWADRCERMVTRRAFRDGKGYYVERRCARKAVAGTKWCRMHPEGGIAWDLFYRPDGHGRGTGSKRKAKV